MYFDISFSAFLFLGLIGISNGLANVLGSSTWAEIYGVRYIGSIKALTTALMVFSTAFGTALFGLLIDKGFSIEQVALVSLIYIACFDCIFTYCYFLAKFMDIYFDISFNISSNYFFYSS